MVFVLVLAVAVSVAVLFAVLATVVVVAVGAIVALIAALSVISYLGSWPNCHYLPGAETQSSPSVSLRTIAVRWRNK